MANEVGSMVMYGARQASILIFRKILTTPFESAKMNRVVTMNGEKEFCLENPLLKEKEEL